MALESIKGISNTAVYIALQEDVNVNRMHDINRARPGARISYRSAAGLLLIGICLCASTGCGSVVVFFGTGTLVQGDECVLFQADIGGLYVLDNLGEFGVGDRVYVMGGFDPNCVSICMEGDGCIRENIIEVPQ